jgi:hypothetical protein
MSYPEDIIKLRKRIVDAVQKGVINQEGKDFLEASLIQIMNEAEKNRQNCLVQAENLRRQAAVMDGQAGAFNSTIAIVYNVINGFVVAEERAQEERARQEAEEKARLEEDLEPVETKPEVKKPGKKKQS